MLSQNEVLNQSKNAMKQWENVWREHAKTNGEIMRAKALSNQRFFGHGIGKKLICVAASPGTDKFLDTLRQKTEFFDIACVDKAYGYLVDNGIIPQFVYVADANVSYEKYGEPWIDKSDKVCIILNVCANPKWAQNWKGNVFYVVNQDNIQTEKLFGGISGCREIVKASSNVGNSVLVHAATYLLYDEYYLIGYEMSWGDDDTYYIGQDSDKRWYMNHIQILNNDGEMVNTSHNLMFSMRWLQDFINAELYQKKKRIYSATRRGILKISYKNLLADIKTYKGREITKQEMDYVIGNRIQNIPVSGKDGEKVLEDVIKKHRVTEVIVRHLPPDLFEAA